MQKLFLESHGELQWLFSPQFTLVILMQKENNHFHSIDYKQHKAWTVVQKTAVLLVFFIWNFFFLR